jgi:hypothetical protein
MKAIPKIIPFVILMILASYQVEGSIFANGIDCSVEPNDCKRIDSNISVTESIALPSLNSLVVQGASYFLKSKANYSILLQLQETGLESASVEKLNDVIEDIEKANQIYIELNFLMSERRYSREIVYRLKNFNYEELMKRENLNPVIFKEVVSFMKEGDTKGVIEAIQKRMQATLDSLYLVKENRLAIRYLWRTSEQYSNLNAFGQYVALIMSEI